MILSRSFFVKDKLPLAAIVCLVLTSWATGPNSTIAQDDEQSARTQRSEKLESRLAELRDQFNLLGEKLGDATDQAADNIRAELDVASKQLSDFLIERRDTYQKDAADVRAALDSAWQKWESQGKQAREMTAKEIGRIRAEWNMAYMNLQKAHHETVNRIRIDLEQLDKDILSASDQVSYEIAARREAIRRAYETRARQMRDSYVSYIEALGNEAERIKKAATTASADTQAEMMAKVDEINAKSNVAFEKMHHSFERIASKAKAYFQQTEARMEDADAEVKGKIQQEMDAVSDDVTALRAELVASMEKYRDSLNSQVNEARQRAAAGGAEINALATKLAAKQKQAETHLVEAYESYAASLENDIDRMKAKLEQADEDVRVKMVKAIEKRQSELERIKEKLR